MDEIAMWIDLIAEASDIEWAYHEAVTQQRLVLLEMACRGAELRLIARRCINSSCVVQDMLARAYVRDELAKRGRVWPEEVQDAD